MEVWVYVWRERCVCACVWREWALCLHLWGDWDVCGGLCVERLGCVGRVKCVSGCVEVETWLCGVCVYRWGQCVFRERWKYRGGGRDGMCDGVCEIGRASCRERVSSPV